MRHILDKKILIGKCYTDGVANAFKELGYEVFNAEKEITRISEKEIWDIAERYKRAGVDYIFSLNFSEYMAKACNSYNIIYISWVWDSPHVNLWSETARFDTNLIFLFDYAQYQIHKNRGLNNVYYLPIGVDCDLFKHMIVDKALVKRYETDVSFVGNLYNDEEHSLWDKVNYLPQYLKGYLDAIIYTHKNVWGSNLISAIGYREWQLLKNYIKLEFSDSFEDGAYEVAMSNIITQKIAQIERMDLCSILNDKYSFSLYTDCDTSFDDRIKTKGHANYVQDMPYIFNGSKVNINTTLKSILTGIPLRALDIMACGGFLLTNYQLEIAEYFENEKDMVFYEDIGDMCEKIDYYMEHEEERKKIAFNGYEKTRKLFSLTRQIGIINDIINS